MTGGPEERGEDQGYPRTYTIEDVLILIAWGQRRNHNAYLDHRKRRETGG
jgi:hypothetical protein